MRPRSCLQVFQVRVLYNSINRSYYLYFQSTMDLYVDSPCSWVFWLMSPPPPKSWRSRKGPEDLTPRPLTPPTLPLKGLPGLGTDMKGLWAGDEVKTLGRWSENPREMKWKPSGDEVKTLGRWSEHPTSQLENEYTSKNMSTWAGF